MPYIRGLKKTTKRRIPKVKKRTPRIPKQDWEAKRQALAMQKLLTKKKVAAYKKALKKRKFRPPVKRKRLRIK